MGIKVSALIEYARACNVNSLLQTAPEAIRRVDFTRCKIVPLSKDVADMSLKGIDYYKALLTDDLIKGIPKFNCSVPNVTLEIEGKTVVGKLLNGGGTKTVYEIVRDGKKEVICLPNKAGNWRKVLDEVQNTKEIKRLGLLANDVCEVQPIVINGRVFPALRMKPYSEHDFKIFDTKNRRSNTGKLEDAISVNEFGLKKFESLFDGIIDDVNILIRNNVSLGSDSINLAQTRDGKLRLYINDIGELARESIYSEKMESMSPKGKKEIAERYLEDAVTAFCNGFSDNVYYSNELLQRLCSLDEVSDIFIKRLLAKINL